jgi:hypothetical protein
MTYAHEHTKDCLAYNELDELCCMKQDNLQNHATWSITLTQYGEPFGLREVFTDTEEDARALVKTQYPLAQVSCVVGPIHKEWP